MTTPASVNDAVEKIGAEVLRHVGSSFQQLFLYAEVEDGVAEASILIRRSGESKVDCIRISWELSELLMDLWDLWGESGEGAKWQALIYRLSADGSFALTPIYQPGLRRTPSFVQRRAELATRTFGSVVLQQLN